MKGDHIDTLDAAGKFDCIQYFAKQKIMLPEMENSNIDKKPEPPMIPFPLLQEQLETLALVKQIISTHVHSN